MVLLLQKYGRMLVDTYNSGILTFQDFKFLLRKSGRLAPVARVGINDPLLSLNSLRMVPWC